MRPYIALIHKATSRNFGVWFPDFPSCVTAGATLDEARDRAAEALGSHIEGLMDEGEALPEPSPLEAVMAERDNRDGVAVLVYALARPAKSVKVNITLPADVLDEVDRYAEAHGLTRSGVLARAARREMAATFAPLRA